MQHEVGTPPEFGAAALQGCRFPGPAHRRVEVATTVCGTVTITTNLFCSKGMGKGGHICVEKHLLHHSRINGGLARPSTRLFMDCAELTVILSLKRPVMLYRMLSSSTWPCIAHHLRVEN